VHISRAYGEQTPLKRFFIILRTSLDLADVINFAKFHIDRSRGYGVAGGPKIACPHRKAESFMTLHRMNFFTFGVSNEKFDGQRRAAFKS
jgi:hypothetical protein